MMTVQECGKINFQTYSITDVLSQNNGIINMIDKNINYNMQKIMEEKKIHL